MQRIWNLMLFGGGVAAILWTDPGLLREDALIIILAATLIAAIGGFFLARKGTAQAGPPAGGPDSTAPIDLAAISHSFIVPGFAALLLSTLYWYRAALSVSGFEDGLGFKLAEAFLFWVPAAFFMSLYRAPGEGLRPSRRKIYILRLITGLVAGLLGMTGASQIHLWYDARYDRTSLADAMAHQKNHYIADDVSITWSHSRRDLDVELTWPQSDERNNYQELRRIRSLASNIARFTSRHDTDLVTIRMTRDGQLFADLEWPADHGRRAWDMVRIDYEAAGISPLPHQADLQHIMNAIPPAARDNRMQAGMIGDTLHLWRAGLSPPGPEKDTRLRDRPTTPSTPPETALSNGQGRIHPELPPDTIRALDTDWRAANHIIRDIRSVFRDIQAYGVTMPGYPPGRIHRLIVPASEADGYFEAQRHLPVPDGHALIQLSDTAGVQIEDTGMRRAPVRLVWNDGRFGPSHNDITLWPWSKGAVGAKFMVYLLDVDDDGNVVLHLEGLDGGAADPGTFRIEPGQTIDLDSVYLAHLGWRRTGAGPQR